MQTETQKPDGANPPSIVVPPMDVLTRDGDLRLLVDLPGVSKDNLTVRVERGTLLVEGRRGDIERIFRRQIRLPDTVDADRIEAELANGVLTVSLPQIASQRPRAIAVR